MEFIAPIVAVSLDLSVHLDVAKTLGWIVAAVILLRN